MATIVTSDITPPTVPSTVKFPQLLRRWVWVMLPFSIILGFLLRNGTSLWFGEGSQLFFQACVPVGAVLIAWSYREDWNQTHQELTTLFPNPRDARRSGNMVLVIVGGALLLMSQIGAMPPLMIFSVWIIQVGAIWYLFGPFLLRIMLTPLAFLLLAIPPPIGFFSGIVQKFQLISASMMGGTLGLIGIKTRIQGAVVVIQDVGHTIFIYPTTSGVGVFCFVLVSTICYLSWGRSNFLRGLIVLMVAAFITCLGNVLRLTFLGISARVMPDFAKILENQLLFIPTITTVFLCLLVIRSFSEKMAPSRTKNKKL
ncbi:exosortase/archaeosortase family protein [Armatimonas sp.]|uniref:exosortase/archaeosortase family protein n=1 Tax=Armatimonas sp. TaxID=1872638 RepID=UPI00286B8E63|nr:exosortase/archaeosortase family protein [Armatimonas sp.]